MILHPLASNNHPENSGKADLLTRAHDVICVLSVLLASRHLLTCIFAIPAAWQDMNKFRDLGADYPFNYYLAEYNLPEHLSFFLCIVVELLIFIILFRRAARQNTFWGSVLYFGIMLVLHEVLWLYAHYLIPGFSPRFERLDILEVHFRTFAARSILPAAAYFVLYLFRVRKIKSDK